MKKNQGTIPILTGIILCLISAGVLLSLESGLPPGEQLTILDREHLSLHATYYSGDQPAGVILAEGFGSDQTALRGLVEAFSRNGFHVLTFDFSGHGRSPGGLGFDNAGTDRLAWQLLAAKDVFEEKTGLSSGQVLVAGHSLGARVALQAAVMADQPPAGLILLGTQVNLVPNVQAEVFTGVSDAELDWVQRLGPGNPPSDILLISGDLDDILTPEAASLLMSQLSGGIDQPGMTSPSSREGGWRRWLLIPNVLHNYEIYSPRVFKRALQGAGEMLESPLLADPARAARSRTLAWGGGIAGLFTLVIGLAGILPGSALPESSPELALKHPGRFLGVKLLLWIPALVPGALLGGLIFLLPLGNPAFNLIYISFLGGYGITLLALYRTGRMPGIAGSLKLDFSFPSGSRLIAILGTFLMLLVATAALARTGWFFVIPGNHRLVWALVFTPITGIGFWIGWHENALISRDHPRPGAALIGNGLIGLLPFFLYAGFLASIGSLSGVVGAVQGLVILLFSIVSGVLLQKIGRSPALTALMQAFLIYWLILPQGVLFS